MTQKEMRKYDLIIEIGNVGGAEKLRELASIDFGAAVDMWGYKVTKRANEFGDVDVFAILESISESKLRAAVLGDFTLLKLIYGAEDSCTGANLRFLASLVVNGKVTEAEEILRSVKNNTNIDFNERMKAVIDAVFQFSMEKTGTKKANLNRKQTMLLLNFVSKMKSGATKNLLTQRLKEL
jgi:hypothetical protein